MFTLSGTLFLFFHRILRSYTKLLQENHPSRCSNHTYLYIYLFTSSSSKNKLKLNLLHGQLYLHSKQNRVFHFVVSSLVHEAALSGNNSTHQRLSNLIKSNIVDLKHPLTEEEKYRVGMIIEARKVSSIFERI